jgi:hypothetical protein
MDRMAAVLEKLGENTKPYEPGFGDPAYQERLKAEGHFDTFPLPVFQNGREAEARGLSQETREWASGLRAGTFKVGPIEVIVERTDRHVHLKYKAATTEDRMRYASAWMDFSDLIAKLHALQA